jgi:hypothetical protein
MTKQHYPASAGIKPIKTNSHALSNASGHTAAGYVQKLKAGGVTKLTGPQPVSVGASPTATSRPGNQKPLAGKASAKPSHSGNK